MITIEKYDCWNRKNLLYAPRFECQILKFKIYWFLFSSCIDLANFWSPNMPNKYRHRSFRPSGIFSNQVGTSVRSGRNLPLPLLMGKGLKYLLKLNENKAPLTPYVPPGLNLGLVNFLNCSGKPFEHHNEII